MTLRIYRPGEAATVMQAPRADIDGACHSGALKAVDITPKSSRRSWRIAESDLADWHSRGRPATP